MTDVESLETLETFVRQHAVCGDHAISTAFAEHRDAAYINVTRWCQRCDTPAVAIVTRAAAAALLRQTAMHGTSSRGKAKD